MAVDKPMFRRHALFICVALYSLLVQCHALGRAGSARGGSTSRVGSYRSSVHFSSAGARTYSSGSSGNSTDLKTILGIVFGILGGLILLSVIVYCCYSSKGTGTRAKHSTSSPTVMNVGPDISSSPVSSICNSNGSAVSPIDAIGMHTYGYSSSHLDSGTAGQISYKGAAYNPPPSYDSVVKSDLNTSDLPYSPNPSDGGPYAVVERAASHSQTFNTVTLS